MLIYKKLNHLVHHERNDQYHDFRRIVINNPNFDSIKSDILRTFVDSYTIMPSLLQESNSKNNQNDFRNNFMNNQNNFMNNRSKLMNNQSKSPINVMNLLYDYDNEHDHLFDFNNLLPNGKSFFTSLANNKHNDEIVPFLLDHGVDHKKPDSNGIFPFEFALMLDSNECALELINSDNIDLTQKIQIKYDNEKDASNPKYTTYLHLAASSRLP